ncbi:FecR family protein [Bradyrhizobium sp.]|uniref:FecR family protein n=1 Tax=Bradyrhizobium sp. TaxID=376 RepID=UPI001EB9461F|nr:FecR family protein [Bradyrhizobium sp.]MBV9982979.1 FecR domain-containing protein [Bradyrhizobium sp.]
MFRISGMPRAMIAALLWSIASSALAAENDTWSVSKSSGDVWVTTTSADAVSLKQEDVLKPGDTIRTGRSGRVLLVRGEETILIAPNSVIGLPTEKKDGLSTTILQQAGSILLDVEKRNVKHFEVETPYLAAVVKGTQFAVTVNADSTSVEVRRGQVEVSDFKSGQIAQVMPGQVATAFARGKPGLSLGGTGQFHPIEHGQPRASSIERIPVPKSGLSAPRDGASGKTIHALGHGGGLIGKLASTPSQGRLTGVNAAVKRNGVRISSALGEVRLNVRNATNGLAHGSEASASGKQAKTVWGDSQASANSAVVASQNSGASGVSSATNAATSSAALASTAAAASAAVSVATSGNGNAATGNGKGNGNGNGNNGNNGNGNNGNGNGNGNGGTGNGNGKGNAKH